MAEPSSGAIAATAILGVTAVSLWPGVDVNAVVGAFAGAMFSIVFASGISGWARAGYLVASWIFGYYMAGEIISREWAKTSGLVGFIGALFCVVVCISLLEWIQGGKTPGWLRFIADRFGGSRNG